jgi:hypothetical protein
MSKKNKLNVRLTFALLLLLAIAPAAAGQSHRFMGRKEFLPYTRNLPAIDRVELLKLTLKDDHGNGEHWNGEIDATKVLQGTKAQRVASLWRKQTYTQSDSACHGPGYAIKFYSRRRLLVYATVCFACSNMFFMTPNLKRTQNFESGNKLGEQLNEIFRLAFAETTSVRRYTTVTQKR